MSDYREIPLTKGYVALVDEADYDDLAQFSWHAQPRRRTVYAWRNVRLSEGR